MVGCNLNPYYGNSGANIVASQVAEEIRIKDNLVYGTSISEVVAYHFSTAVFD
jgi:hypothetical protein